MCLYLAQLLLLFGCVSIKRALFERGSVDDAAAENKRDSERNGLPKTVNHAFRSLRGDSLLSEIDFRDERQRHPRSLHREDEKAFFFFFFLDLQTAFFRVDIYIKRQKQNGAECIRGLSCFICLLRFSSSDSCKSLGEPFTLKQKWKTSRCERAASKGNKPILSSSA